MEPVAADPPDMITTKVTTGRLIHSLTRRAEALALGRGKSLVGQTLAGPVNWHSARSLWPEIELD